MNAPDFFIVGHPKCGTTALFEILRKHPEIFLPDCKETFYFADELRAPEHRRAESRLPQTLDQYLQLFSEARPGQRTGEASALYLWSRKAAEHIAGLQPDARIIAILREPASFLRSLHLQLVQSHVESQKDFRKALLLEDSRREGNNLPRASSHWPLQLLYSDYVRYVEQLRRFQDLIPAEQILVLIYDDFRGDNDGTVREVLRFLDVDETVPLVSVEANPTVRVRSRSLNRFLYDLRMGRGAGAATLKRGITAVVPRKLRRRVLETIQHRLVFGEPPPTEDELMTGLRRRFKPEVVALSEYMERDLVKLWGYDGIESR